MASQGGGERHEKPTSKRIKDAREKGQVARSRDLSGALSLFGVTLALAWFGGTMIANATWRMQAAFTTAGDQARATLEPSYIASTFRADGWLLCVILGPPVVAAALFSMAGSFAQIGFAFSPKALHVNWNRLNPSSGFARLGPKQALPELVKAFVGIAAVGSVAWLFLWQFTPLAVGLTGMHPVDAAAYGWDRLWTLLWRACLVLAFLAGADYGLQYWRWYDQLKMTRQEVRDEARLQEGSPEIKARVRRAQREMSQRRMLQAVKTATVVVTNPTHFAVALDTGAPRWSRRSWWPRGDLMAAKIREVAARHGVPIVENVTLARALHAGVEVGETIPAALFGAVAEVLAYSVRLKQLVL
ncbi:MAG: EscU/YscU/HrcU family type III secretion system export apparatus switch protein [Vicinamibacterales bacterium]